MHSLTLLCLVAVGLWVKTNGQPPFNKDKWLKTGKDSASRSGLGVLSGGNLKNGEKESRLGMRSSSGNAGECPSYKFLCANDNCIWHSWVCDLENDCGDGSDEINCGCPSHKATCANGNCIRRSWVCDLDNDCGDGSDETDCTSCPYGASLCSTKICILDKWFCDGDNDCGNNEDEQFCDTSCNWGPFGKWGECNTGCGSGQRSRTRVCDCGEGYCEGYSTEYEMCNGNDCYLEAGGCPSNKFTCANGNCVELSWVCDLDNDCGDGSDETDCTSDTSCNWGPFGKWGDCNTGCGSGQRSRTRVCDCGDGYCEGYSTEYEICNGNDCYPEAASGCGTRKYTETVTRIVGGEDATRGEWPWQAQLFYGSFACGGTIISNSYVITAAHCFPNTFAMEPSEWKVQLGKLYARDSIDAGLGEYESDVEAILIHPDYDSSSSDNDIALLKLKDPLPRTSDYVNYACLANDRDIPFDESSNCYATGFGTLSSGGSLARVLQEANIPVVPSNTCRYSYRSLTSNMICAGLLKGGIDSCQGDSGGPFVCTAKDADADTERWYLVGVTSFGSGCAVENKPGVYTKVSQYFDWIRDNMV